MHGKLRFTLPKRDDAMIGRSLLLAAAMVCMAAAATAFDANGSSIDVNFGDLYDVSYTDAASDDNSIKSSISLGDAPTGTWDGNGISVRTGTYFDQNRPIATITSPAEGFSTSASEVTMTYTGEYAGNPIAKFWVRVDDESARDNGLNTSYTFTSMVAGSHALAVFAMDTSDINGPISSIGVTTGATSGTSTVGGTGAAGGAAGGTGGGGGEGGGGAAGGAPPDRVFFTKNGVDLNGQVEVMRTAIQNYEYKDNRLTGYNYDFNVSIRNISGNVLQDITVFEYVPKEITESLRSLRASPEPSEIREPEIIVWKVASLAPGEEVLLYYYPGKIADKTKQGIEFNKFFLGIPMPKLTVGAETVSELAACSKLNCNDSNPCTQDLCVKGACSYFPRNGSSCGNGLVCEQTSCVPRKTPVEEAVSTVAELVLPKDAEVALPIMGGAIVAAILAATVFMGLKKWRRHPWGLG